MLAEQDHKLDRINDVVGMIRHENENFTNEVTMQNKMLDKVNDDIDDNLQHMVKLDSKLKVMLAKGGMCKLWIILVVEFVLFLWLLITAIGG